MVEENLNTEVVESEASEQMSDEVVNTTGFDSFIEAESVESAAVGVEGELPISAEIDEKSTLFDEIEGVLAELHITKKQIFMLVIFALVVLTIIVASFVFLLRFLGDDVATVDVPKEKPVEVVEEVKNGSDGFIDKILGLFDSENENDNLERGSGEVVDVANDNVDSVTVVTDLGNEEARPITDINLVIEDIDSSLEPFAGNVFVVINEFGQSEKLNDRLSFYTRTFRRVRNTFNTDLFLILDNAVDRNVAFEEYLNSFKAHNAEAIRAFEDLRQEIASLEETLARVSEVKAEAEQKFLDASQELVSEQMPLLLDRFQELAAKEVVVRSELRARQQIAVRYENGLPLIAEKIVAIETNKDAFVKGVKVIEFPQIDLDLVVEP